MFRWTDYDTPFWARPNTRDGRWNSAREEPTQYWSLLPDAAWADLIRQEHLATEEEVGLVRIPVWVAAVRVENVADYSTFEKAHACGFSPEALVADEYEESQAEARRLRQLGYAGLLTPSAALPEALNLTLFGARLLGTWGKPPDLASAIPACRVAVGSPPPGLVGRVRRRGTPHPGLQAFRAVADSQSFT